MRQQNIGDKPAFPGLGANGLTYREWLIGQALQGFCANSVLIQPTDPSYMSQLVLRQVDNLLEHLQKEDQP